MIKDLIVWSKEEFSHLPWRRERSLYTTLVSEIMLQQTTVSTVLNHYERFLERYPDVEAVASTSEEELTASWKGLGYYRRARNLKKACEYFCANFNGEIPVDFDSLLAAPGVGEYTANALISIGANQRALALDANLERVLARLYGLKEQKGPKLIKRIYNLFQEEKICSDLNNQNARDYNEALMDLGRTYCKASKASCELCPLSAECAGHKERRPLLYPVKGENKAKKAFRLELLRIIVQRNNELLCYKKKKSEWLSGQWEVPTFIISSEDSELAQYSRINFPHSSNLPEYKSAITKYKIINRSVILNLDEFKSLGLDPEDYVFKDPRKSHFSSGSHKAIDLLL